jgi:hypothetical protein
MLQVGRCEVARARQTKGAFPALPDERRAGAQFADGSRQAERLEVARLRIVE